MNVSSTSTSQIFQQMMSTSSTSSTSSLTDEESQFIQDLLEDYDAENLSSTDAQDIMQALKEGGIMPGAGLESALSDAGFDAKTLHDTAMEGMSGRGGGGMMPPPPPKDEEQMSEITELLETLMSSDDDETSTASNSSFDTIMNYTGQILGLNDEATTEVMDLLETYNSEDNEYSKEDTQKLVANSLNQILEDQSNYNRVSIYA